MNERLWLQNRRWRAIGGLEKFTGVRMLHLENNQIGPRVGLGLRHLAELRAVYLNCNMLREVDNLSANEQLTLLNLATNQISAFAPDSLPRSLNTLECANNILERADALAPLALLPNLEVLNLQNNRLADERLFRLFSSFPALRVLYLQGNPIQRAENYRRRLVSGCVHLTYLDDCPVETLEKRGAEAWAPAAPSRTRPAQKFHDDKRAAARATRRIAAERAARRAAASLNADASGRRVLSPEAMDALPSAALDDAWAEAWARRSVPCACAAARRRRGGASVGAESLRARLPSRMSPSVAHHRERHVSGVSRGGAPAGGNGGRGALRGAGAGAGAGDTRGGGGGGEGRRRGIGGIRRVDDGRGGRAAARERRRGWPSERRDRGGRRRRRRGGSRRRAGAGAGDGARRRARTEGQKETERTIQLQLRRRFSELSCGRAEAEAVQHYNNLMFDKLKERRAQEAAERSAAAATAKEEDADAAPAEGARRRNESPTRRNWRGCDLRGRGEVAERVGEGAFACRGPVVMHESQLFRAKRAPLKHNPRHFTEMRSESLFSTWRRAVRRHIRERDGVRRVASLVRRSRVPRRARPPARVGPLSVVVRWFRAPPATPTRRVPTRLLRGARGMRFASRSPSGWCSRRRRAAASSWRRSCRTATPPRLGW